MHHSCAYGRRSDTEGKGSGSCIFVLDNRTSAGEGFPVSAYVFPHIPQTAKRYHREGYETGTQLCVISSLLLVLVINLKLSSWLVRL